MSSLSLKIPLLLVEIRFYTKLYTCHMCLFLNSFVIKQYPSRYTWFLHFSTYISKMVFSNTEEDYNTILDDKATISVIRNEKNE